MIEGRLSIENIKFQIVKNNSNNKINPTKQDSLLKFVF